MELQKIIILMGPPGSGKGTQSRLLIEKLGCGYFSMGDTLREYTKMDTELGHTIKNLIDKGSAVDDEIATKVFEESFRKINLTKGAIVDGYPRSMAQLENLNQLLSELGNFETKVILIEVDEQKLTERLMLRAKNQGRADDSDISSIKKRFDEYRNKTSIARDHYESKGELIRINGDQTIEEVHKDIMNSIKGN